jgi:hypothetical protein
MEILEFKKNCILLDPERVVQKYLIEGDTYFFSKITKDDELDFKKEIATTLKVHIRDIVIVGSGKLGFSIKPDLSIPEKKLYKYKEFDYNFKKDQRRKKSDLDVGIVSSSLFDKEIENLFFHTKSYDQFKGVDRTAFAKYILKGRFIFDYLPDDFPLTKETDLVQTKFMRKYTRDLKIEIYKSWNYFESYHKNNILNIKLNLITL